MGDRNDWPARNRKAVVAAWHVLAHKLGLIPAVPAESVEWLQRRELMRNLDPPEDAPPAGEPEDDEEG